MTIKPATPLPWAHEQIGVSDAGPNGVDVFDIGPVDHEGCMRVRVATVADEDAAYIVHAANAYPKLVEALRSLVKAEEEYGDQGNVAINEAWMPAAALLRELGEDK